MKVSLSKYIPPYKMCCLVLIILFALAPITISMSGGIDYSGAYAATEGSAGITTLMSGLSEPCRATGDCTDADVQLMRRIVAACPVSKLESGKWGIDPSVCTPEEIEAFGEIANPYKEKRRNGPISCKVGWTNLSAIFDPVCWGRTISVIIGAVLISITAWLLALAGLLFDFVIDVTIVQFGALFDSSLKAGIDAGWTVFRDLSNIVIIGMFTFIAISLILGIKEYGERKMIARVLIIAVLINFSLLFTKMIIDASNFTAKQFHAAATTAGLPASAVSETTGVNPFSGEFAQTGIAGRFVQYMGVTSIGDTVKALSQGAFGSKENNYADADGLKTLLHGVFSSTLLLAAALVFLY